MTAKALLMGQEGIRLEGVVTRDDLENSLDALASRLLERDEQFVDAVSGVTDASGNLTLTLTEVPAGKEANIFVVVLEAAGYTPGSPFSGAGAYISLHRGQPTVGNTIDFTVSSTGVFPCLFSYGGDARLLRSSQTLVARIAAGPASTSVVASVQGILRPTVLP